MFAVYGLAVRNGLVSLARFAGIARAEGEELGSEQLVPVAAERVAPTLLAARAVAVAMIPPAILGGSAGYELLRPLAIVVLGGLATSTFVTLVALPVFYLRYCASLEPAAEAVSPEEVATLEPA